MILFSSTLAHARAWANGGVLKKRGHLLLNLVVYKSCNKTLLAIIIKQNLWNSVDRNRDTIQILYDHFFINKT